MKNLIWLKFLLVFFLSIFCVPSFAQKNTETSIDVNIQDSLAFELCKIYALDQGIHNALLWKESQEMENAIGLTSIKIDSVLFDQLISFIKIHGYPNKELVGSRNYKYECVQAAAGVVLLHNPRRLLTPEVYNLLKNEAKKGNMPASFLEIYLDKYYVFYQKKSLYNSQFKFMLKTNKGVCREDKALSDSLRVDIGLQPLPDSVFVNCKCEK
jgi:hypothetical protein